MVVYTNYIVSNESTNLLSPYATILSKNSFVVKESQLQNFKQMIKIMIEMLGFEPELVLDVGAGCGIISHYFAERGCRVIAIEPYNHFCQDNPFYKIKRIELLNITVEEYLIKRPKYKFDIIIAHSSLSYIKNTQKVLYSLAELLSPNGCINISGCLRRYKKTKNVFLRMIALITGSFFYPYKT